MRNYEKKGSKATDAAIRAAANLVLSQGNKGQRAAARCVGISTTTLRKMMDKIQSEEHGNAPEEPGSGVSTSLHPVVEAELADIIRVMVRSGFPPSQSDIPGYVQSWIKADIVNREVAVWEHRDQKPGEEWVRSFMKRNRLSLKTSGAMERKRKTATEDPFLVYDYFDKLELVIAQLGLENRPDRIFNTDETCFCHDPDKIKVVGIRGEKTERVRGGPGRDNTAVLATCCADGSSLDPLVIFTGQRMQAQWVGQNTAKCPALDYGVSKKGWINSEIFEEWFVKTFVPHVQQKGDGPALLAHSSHHWPIGVQGGHSNVG